MLSMCVQEMEEEAAANRARRAPLTAFLQLLKDNTPTESFKQRQAARPHRPAGGTRSSTATHCTAHPDINGDTTYEEAKVALQDNPAWTVSVCVYMCLFFSLYSNKVSLFISVCADDLACAAGRDLLP